ncbi:MAG TPA: hypothetical protein VHS80_00935 [Chthoniobacterales bacterium]|nr:hypothetical protein [Chthoniobacterales bacterium]
MKLTSSTLRKAAEIQERIERLQSELDQVLEVKEGFTPVVAPAPVARRANRVSTRARRSGSTALNSRGRGRRSTSPTGPLAPAVVRVLKSRGGPMGVSEILDGLLKNGYKFNSPEPKKNLFARIYRLKGVRQVGPGQFSAA